MKKGKIIFLFSFLIVVLGCISSVAAIEDVNVNLTDDSSNLELACIDESGFNDDNSLSASLTDDSVLSEPKTIIVEEVEKDHNEMTDPTIQKAIDSANAGDTIIIKGTSYVHCHFVVDKQLTILSDVGTTMEVCPGSTAGSGYKGIFYVSPKASGTIIEGFTITSDVQNDNDYGILVKGASDVIIRNCNVANKDYADAIRVENAKTAVIENITLSNAKNGIRIKDSQGVNVNNICAVQCENGIDIVDSIQTTISNSSFSKNTITGIAYSGNGNDLTVIYNNITENGDGIRLTSTDNVNILSNYIAFNAKNGVYVDYNITKLNIKGNFFNQNKWWDVFNDFHVKNINDINLKNPQNLEVITNNYMINYGGYGSGDMDRPVWTQVYEYNTKIGDYNYDPVNDVYVYVGEGNGEYYGHQGIMYLGYIFDINNFLSCPNIYVGPNKIWSLSGNYHLYLSEITQVKKGIYSISIVDVNGNVASELSSVPVTFYLNKASQSSTPREGDIYRTVMMENGTATVRFYPDEYNESGNVITAVTPTPGTIIDEKVSKTFSVSDDDIPGIVTNTSIIVSNLNTYPNSKASLTLTLKDANGNVIPSKAIRITLNSKNYTRTTDDKGQAKLEVSISKEGTYTLNAYFEGDGIDYNGCSAQSKVVVKKTTTKIISSNVNMIPKRGEYYSITLKDSSNKVISNQKITFKVNGKTYNKKTNSNGIAKVKLTFNQNKKTYQINIKFAGNNQYKAVSKTNKITVKYSSKTAKLTAPTVTIPPKTSKSYTVTLKDDSNKGISKQKVTIKVNGKTYNKKTNSNGKASITVKFNFLKIFKVTASYKGSNIYKKASASGKIKVAKTATKITAPTVSTLPNVAKSYTVTLKTSAGKALSKQKVTIKVNGKTYTKTTNSKGQASVSVKLSNEKTYAVNVNYKATAIYKASKATGKIKVAKITTQIESYDRTFAADSNKEYSITLKDASGNPISGQKITCTIGDNAYSQTTDSKGKITINLANQNETSFNIVSKYAGNSKYKAASKTNTITISDKTNVVFIDKDLPNSEIQNILDLSVAGSNVEFLGDNYADIALTISKPAKIYSNNKTTLNAKKNSPVFKIVADNVDITNFVLKGNSGDAIDVNADNVVISYNTILNKLDESKSEDYASGNINMPGYGVNIHNSSNVKILRNDINLFESGIFAQYSSDLVINKNTLKEDNYGIKYGYGVANTQIINNEISDLIGLYTMTVPEGPSGYGIFLNNSAVNVTINHNHIANNHMGISIDANYSTGIVVTQNTITDNVLEGMRFNAGYDLAENAVEPIVTDNAIYRNARGPSMMILGELSANPEGIYGEGLINPEKRLKLDPNWYGTNKLVVWNNDTGDVGYGTMCPRINTTPIVFNVTFVSPGTYSVKFYKNGVFASNLPMFDMYATLNRGSDKQVEINFDVVNGAGIVKFNADNYLDKNNKIEFSIGSLLHSTSRTFKVTYLYNVPESEIPVK